MPDFLICPSKRTKSQRFENNFRGRPLFFRKKFLVFERKLNQGNMWIDLSLNEIGLHTLAEEILDFEQEEKAMEYGKLSAFCKFGTPELNSDELDFHD